MSVKEQPIFSITHSSRLWKCVKELSILDMVNIKDVNGDAYFSLTLKGHLITPILIGFGLLEGDKDFDRYRENAIK